MPADGSANVRAADGRCPSSHPHHYPPTPTEHPSKDKDKGKEREEKKRKFKEREREEKKKKHKAVNEIKRENGEVKPPIKGWCNFFLPSSFFSASHSPPEKTDGILLIVGSSLRVIPFACFIFSSKNTTPRPRRPPPPGSSLTFASCCSVHAWRRSRTGSRGRNLRGSETVEVPSLGDLSSYLVMVFVHSAPTLRHLQVFYSQDFVQVGLMRGCQSCDRER